MEETKHKIKIKRHSRRNWHAAAACLLSIALLVCLSAQYLSFVSKTIYAESTEHLEELLHKSNNMLSMIVKKNTSYLHVWNGFLSSDPDDASTQAYLESAQQQLGFAEFYFLSYDGNYMTPSGKTGYLGLQSNLDEQLSDQKDVVLNTALPGQDPMLVFICPETKGIYRGFAYDAIAISHYNNVVMKAVDDSAFGGTASSFVIYPDGQVVIENISEGSESIYNFVAILQEYSDLTEAQIQELTDDFAQGITGNREVTLDGTRYYMVYESTGIQNWILVGLVPRDSVNAAMNQLWQRTMQIVALVVLSIAAMVLLMVMHRGRTKLRRQNTAILYRDVLFEKLSQNVDDVFLLLDAQSERRQRTLYGLADILYYGDDRRCDAPYGPYTPLLLRMMQNEKPILTVTHSPFNDALRAGCAVPAGQVTQRGVEEALLSFTMMNGEKRVALGRQAGDALCITHAPAQVARDYRGALLRLWV